MDQKKAIGLLSIPVLVAALGYFVQYHTGEEPQGYWLDRRIVRFAGQVHYQRSDGWIADRRYPMGCAGR